MRVIRSNGTPCHTMRLVAICRIAPNMGGTRTTGWPDLARLRHRTLRRPGSCCRSGVGERLNRREAHLPTQYPEAGQDPRVPQAHVDPGRSGDPEVAAAQGAPPSHRLSARACPDGRTDPSPRRLRGSCSAPGARASCGPVRASFVPAAAGAVGVFPQVGYAIGKHCGNAVVRNRLRRRMRESPARSPAPCRAGPTRSGSSPAAATAATAPMFVSDRATSTDQRRPGGLRRPVRP